jgi:hypothetical protein
VGVKLGCVTLKEKLPHYCFSWIVSFRNRDKCEMLPLEIKQTITLAENIVEDVPEQRDRRIFKSKKE